MAVNQSQQAVAAKIRARYGRFLTEKDYLTLAQSGGVSDILSYLVNHGPYGFQVPASSVSMQMTPIQPLLTQQYYEDLDNLLRFDCFLGSDLYRIVTEEVTVDLILDFCRHCNADTLSEFSPKLPPFLEQHLDFPLQALTELQNYSQLISFLSSHPYADAINACLPKPSEPINLTKLEYHLLTCYYTRLFRRMEDNPTQYRNTKELFSIKVDVENLQKLLRCQQYWKQDDCPDFLPFGTIPTKKLKEWFSLSQSKTLENIKATPYGKQLSDHLPADVAFGYILIYRCHQKIRMLQEIPALLVTYMILSRYQIQCIVTIAEGVRYGMTPDAITNLLPLCNSLK